MSHINVIELKNITKVFTMGDEKITVLNDINLSFEKGKIYCLLGVSGSGKSTLLNIMAGLERPTSGQIIFDGNEEVNRMSEKQLALFRQKYVGFVFQSYNLMPTLTALENVTLPLTFRKVPAKIRNKRAYQMLKAVGLGDRYAHKPNQLSGGQQQRISIARAFVNNPSIVFADEPTGNLDTRTTTEMMDLITGFAKTLNQTLILVTHNLELTSYCDEIIYIRDGKIDKIEPVDKTGAAVTVEAPQ